MVKVVGDGQIVHTYFLDRTVLFHCPCLELFCLEDVVSRCSRIFHLLHLSIHVCNIIVHVNNLVVCLLLSCSRIVNVVHDLHCVVHINDCPVLACIRYPRLEPIVF